MSGVVIKASQLLTKSHTPAFFNNFGVITRSAAVYSGTRAEQAVPRDANNSTRKTQNVQYTGSSLQNQAVEDEAKSKDNYAKSQSDAKRKEGFQKLFF